MTTVTASSKTKLHTENSLLIDYANTVATQAAIYTYIRDYFAYLIKKAQDHIPEQIDKVQNLTQQMVFLGEYDTLQARDLMRYAVRHVLGLGLKRKAYKIAFDNLYCLVLGDIEQISEILFQNFITCCCLFIDDEDARQVFVNKCMALFYKGIHNLSKIDVEIIFMESIREEQVV